MSQPLATQYRLFLEPGRPCQPRPEWGYRLYASLLQQAPAGFAGQVHQDLVTPVSQYLAAGPQGLCWVVTLFGPQSHAALGGLLAGAGQLCLQKGPAFAVARRQVHTLPSLDALLKAGEASGAQHRLWVRTPAAFKSKGAYQCLPTQRLIMQSLVKKWNGCFADCPIEDTDGQGVEALAAGLRCTQFALHSQGYALKGHTIPGFAGELVLQNRLSGFHRTLASALLIFSGYAGIGVKTALGMGGTEHAPG